MPHSGSAVSAEGADRGLPRRLTDAVLTIARAGLAAMRLGAIDGPGFVPHPGSLKRWLIAVRGGCMTVRHQETSAGASVMGGAYADVLAATGSNRPRVRP
ncbi:hypothetical protein GCM10010140_40360 [Streptosporangium pseudovulgare]|uniref:Tetracyclin repressor-like C-terminal domain-containing protein n=1 Tax=Streptosporangium pseudovulgare TaxID=35765 RepID=A0ABQ2R3E6_9ACTN|nr:hypothetical protein GCM10010140_40360 [Streptosporangium pseudovulgare]